MSKNSGITQRQALRHLGEILALDEAQPHALPGAFVKAIKDAKRLLLRRKIGQKKVIASRLTDGCHWLP